MWRIVHNILPTQLNLARRHLEVEVDYFLCGALGESNLHLLRDCPFAICVWLAPVSSSLRWTLPPPRFIKVEVDGAWLDGLKLGGVGIIARNDNGEFLAARVTRFDDVFSLQQVEALAAREGLAMLVEKGFQNVIFETDSLHGRFAGASGQ